MAKICVKCGKPIPFMEGVRHAEGMYCRQCDIDAFVKQNCSADAFIERSRRESASVTEGRKASAEQQQPSPVEEIRKYKALLDDGIISQEEFESKKKQLLGL